MNISEIEVPYISYDDIRLKAEDFLYKYNQPDEIPVPIDKIIEIDLDIRIIPIHNLLFAFDIDGFIANNFRTICVDLQIYNNNENRYKFTITHEYGHRILHESIYESLNFSDEKEWKIIICEFDSNQYGYMQTQANSFAGLVLVPSENLKEEYDKAIIMLKNENFDIEKNIEIINEYVCVRLSKIFGVSETVIEIRLEKDNIIPRKKNFP